MFNGELTFTTISFAYRELARARIRMSNAEQAYMEAQNQIRIQDSIGYAGGDYGGSNADARKFARLDFLETFLDEEYAAELVYKRAKAAYMVAKDRVDGLKFLMQFVEHARAYETDAGDEFIAALEEEFGPADE